jgi:hypothetical protein
MRAVLFCLVLTGCAALPWQADRHDPRAIFDAYLIAHGMVHSYEERPDADPAVTLELTRLDQQAHLALVNLARAPGSDVDDSARAVAALSDFAARQTTLPR